MFVFDDSSYCKLNKNIYGVIMKAKQVLNLLKITRPTLSKYVKEGRLSVDSSVNGQYNK